MVRSVVLNRLLAVIAFGCLVGLMGPGLDVRAQDAAPAKIEVEPAELKLEIGETKQLKVQVKDKDGNVLDTPVVYFPRSRRAVSVDDSGKVTAVMAGSFSVTVMTTRSEGQERIRVSVPITVAHPALKTIELTEPRKTLYVGTTVPVAARAMDSRGKERENAALTFASSDDKVASLDGFGNVQLHQAGTFVLSATAEGVKGEQTIEVVELPVRKLTITVPKREARTGDVLRFEASARDASGEVVADAPVHYSFYLSRSGGLLSHGGAAQIEQDGRFVAEEPGDYTVVATCGNLATRATVRIGARNVRKRVQVVGRGKVFDTHTSDLWVWEGVDGRDYAVTGTWGANGDAHFWDVTEPSKIERISTVTVDARTVNDVKVSEDGKLCVISREGASNRKNGLVIINVEDPRNPKIVARFDQMLTGGVHNVFIHQNHIYAINNGRRYDIINIEDPAEPKRVGGFELTVPGHAVHDVWVVDGIAYSSNWGNGLYLVDVGNGIAGGSPSNPKVIRNYTYPSSASHAAFPYYSDATGRSYVIGGDERFPYGLSTRGKPTIAGGYFHFVDFTNPENPQEVARYELPEAGSHNMWVEGDVLYMAMYNAGLRVLDISGELMGDLANQGREIARFVPHDPEGYIPNASMVWGPQPHKGLVYFSDWNTGLWAVRLVDGPRGRGLIRSGQ